MRIRDRTFNLPKAGNCPEEYEDAHRVDYHQVIDASGRDTARVVVSDGASESAFAREWANILRDAFVDRPLDLSSLTGDSLHDWLAQAQEEWDSVVPWDRIPWHGEAKARAGAFATLLVMTIEEAPDDSERLPWQAAAVGDSCLFVVRDDRLKLSFPLEDAAEFDNNPALVCSKPHNEAGLWESLHQESGECTPGDLLILATDPLACWFLAKDAAGDRPWDTLLALDSSQWPAWIGEQRTDGLMRNDDTTMVIIEVV